MFACRKGINRNTKLSFPQAVIFPAVFLYGLLAVARWDSHACYMANSALAQFHRAMAALPCLWWLLSRPSAYQKMVMHRFVIHRSLLHAPFTNFPLHAFWALSVFNDGLCSKIKHCWLFFWFLIKVERVSLCPMPLKAAHKHPTNQESSTVDSVPLINSESTKLIIAG